MKIRIVSFTPAGFEQALNIAEKLKDMGFEPEICEKEKTDGLIKDSFDLQIPLIFVCACGIAVRKIAPYIQDKLKDIPVLVIDETGKFVIPVLSGHAGGANALAVKLSRVLDAVCVTTTATDINETFSPDVFAVQNRLKIMNKDGIKKVSSKVLEGKPILISVCDHMPETGCDILISEENVSGYTLWLSPKKFVLGIGCRKGKSLSDIEAAVETVIDEAGIAYDDIYAFGSVNIKADEEGLKEFSAKHRIPFVTFAPEMLKRAPGEFKASAFVEEVTGVDNVCERAAVLLAGGRGKIRIGKTVLKGVTVALAERIL
ncbi:MAG: cobalamin biosynthesis protein [Lachnospiraceae bacterium]|nr:cobalamin biosynthesis protein [Lachnospiraceae bacterium]